MNKKIIENKIEREIVIARFEVRVELSDLIVEQTSAFD